MNRKRFLICVLFLLTGISNLISQPVAVINGLVIEPDGAPLAGASVVDRSTGNGVHTNASGNYRITVPANRPVVLEISFVGFAKDSIIIQLGPSEALQVVTTLKELPREVNAVVVQSTYDRAEALQQISLKSIDKIPLPSGNIESLLTTLGASSRNEMSSQYSVRGGNFDENLIYVNGIEIYKPMLVKAGQQEGLSFINPSLVSSVQFAAGGFDARYGDKMSSVLDIRYRRPVEPAGSISASLLGAGGHFEGSAIQGKFTHITGLRYKSNQYLLQNMQTEGDFKPNFFDLQTYLTFDLTPKLEVSFLGNLAVNTYLVVPESRETAFGTYQQPLNFTVYYEGMEKDRFSTMLGALSFEYRVSEKLSLKLTGSAFNTYEKITYDILGQYRIDLLDNTPGSETAGDSILNLGVGGNLIHARNFLNANIFNISHKGSYRSSGNNLDWGFTVQSESFSDDIREWELIDSAGYSIPFSDEEIRLQHVIISENNLKSYRFNGYIQNIFSAYAGNSELLINAGFRMGYLNINRRFIFSPRMRITYIPDWNAGVTFHSAIGWYHQPPFYKEMRDPSGTLHRDIKAQKSVHFLVGSAIDLSLWERPFKFTAEAYYKHLSNLIPYIIDDVDIQYLPQYTARGYATGIEFKINGEFVRDAESWATLSFLRTRENRKGDGLGEYPRATDQLVNFGFFFQDYFPNNPSFRVHLNMYYGSRLPYNAPYNAADIDNPLEYYHLKSYRRIDIGLSKSLMTDRHGNRKYAAGFIKDFFFSAEVFNLFGFKNQASYQWVKTVGNQEGIPNIFAVPNYLTGRLLNLRIVIKF